MLDLHRIARRLAPHVQQAPDPDAWLREFAAAFDELLPKAIAIANRRTGCTEIPDAAREELLDELLPEVIDRANRRVGVTVPDVAQDALRRALDSTEDDQP